MRHARETMRKLLRPVIGVILEIGQFFVNQHVEVF